MNGQEKHYQTIDMKERKLETCDKSMLIVVSVSLSDPGHTRSLIFSGLSDPAFSAHKSEASADENLDNAQPNTMKFPMVSKPKAFGPVVVTICVGALISLLVSTWGVSMTVSEEAALRYLHFESLTYIPQDKSSNFHISRASCESCIIHSHGALLEELSELSTLTGEPLGENGSKDLDCPKPLKGFHNLIHIPKDPRSEHHRIPRILHVTFKNRCLPQDLARHLERWREKLPDYSIVFHDDESVDRLLTSRWTQQIFPHLNETMKCVQNGAMKIDIWRVLLLYRYGGTQYPLTKSARSLFYVVGCVVSLLFNNLTKFLTLTGVYTDIDNWPLDKFTPELIDEDISAFFFSDIDNRPSQWFLAMEPSHPIAYFALLTILKQIYEMEDIAKPKVVYTTGPVAFDKGFERFLLDNPDLHDLSKGTKLVGLGLRKVKKIKRKDVTDSYIQSCYQYDEMVPLYSRGKNVTRRERIEIEGQSVHWTKSLNNQHFPHISCQSFLRQKLEADLEASDPTSAKRKKARAMAHMVAMNMRAGKQARVDSRNNDTTSTTEKVRQ